jgi:hypothetical protein
VIGIELLNTYPILPWLSGVFVCIILCAIKYFLGYPKFITKLSYRKIIYATLTITVPVVWIASTAIVPIYSGLIVKPEPNFITPSMFIILIGFDRIACSLFMLKVQNKGTWSAAITSYWWISFVYSSSIPWVFSGS